MSEIIIAESQYSVNPNRMEEIMAIENRIQSIREEISSDCHQSEQSVKIHEELNTYKVKIENFFAQTEEKLLPIKE